MRHNKALLNSERTKNYITQREGKRSTVHDPFKSQFSAKGLASIAGILIISILVGCSSYLEQKADGRLTVPTTVEDFQAMMDNFSQLNNEFASAGEVSSDDFYLTDADLRGLYYETDRRLYTWQPDFVARPQSSAGDEWYNCYRGVNICNLVLKGIADNDLSGSEVDNVRGQALMMRAVRFLDAAQTWCVAYSASTASSDLGIVLKLDPDPNIPSSRSTLGQTYQKILEDMQEALGLLAEQQLGKTQPTKTVALGMLARVHLYMGNYEAALEYLDQIDASMLNLIDFNTIDASRLYPIPVTANTSQEILLRTNALLAAPLNTTVAKIDTILYASYDENDLRKTVYFRANPSGSYFFRGAHTGSMTITPGLSSSEVLLMKAECYAQVNNLEQAANALNQLLVKRYKQGSFVPYRFSQQQHAIDIIKSERRKELVMRGLRWPDIKRFNRDGANITLERFADGQGLSLPPNDPRYAIAIPEEVIMLSGMQQNPR